MSNEHKSTRRDLILKASTLLPAGLALLATSRVFAADKPAAAKPAAAGTAKLVAETDPTAKALKYVHDATKAKREKRGVTEGKDQNCSNCQLYTMPTKIDGKDAGKCLMIQGGLVAAAGWCASWAKKA
jgi:hypothetical protein